MTSAPNQQWAVLGGGMLGLTMAYRLAQQGYKVTVYEASTVGGGLTAGFNYGALSWDRFYHVIEARDKHLLELVDELDLGNLVGWGTTKTNLYDGKQIYPLNNAIDYLKLPTLSFVNKIRLAMNILYAASRRDGAALEEQSAEQWLVRWSGRETYENLWRPLLRSKLGDNLEIASAAYIWAIIRRFYGARHGAQQTELFGYLKGGYTKLIEALNTKLEQLGVHLEYGHPVSGVRRAGDAILVKTKSETKSFDRVVVTFASPIAKRICLDIPGDDWQQHNALRYQGVVCASVLLRRPLGGAYLTYITDREIPFTTVIEMSSLIDRSEFDGLHLAYLPRYMPSEDPWLQAPDADIKNLLMPGLLKMFRQIGESDIESFHVARAQFVSTISTIGYSRNLPSVNTSVAGLYICNSAQIVNASLTVSESVDLANRSVRELLSFERQ